MEIEIRVNDSIHDAMMKMMLQNNTNINNNNNNNMSIFDRNIDPHYSRTEIENYDDDDDDDDDDEVEKYYDYYCTLYVYKSRILWYGLVPLLLDAPYSISKKALQCIIINQQNHVNDNQYHHHRHHHHRHHHHSSNFKEQQPSTSSTSFSSPSSSSSSSSSSTITTATKIRRPYRRRKFKWTIMNNQSIITRESSNPQQMKPKQQRRRRIVINIQPIHNITQYEYYYESLLLYYEHTIIRYISMIGYISTLGGGYFLCHHYTTAIQLAKIQQQIALILNDIILYYTCYIHISYNYIYNGQFHYAKFILYHMIQHILSMNNNNNTNTKNMNNTHTNINSSNITTTTTTNTININNMPSKYYILLQMCYSALLFCKRMSKFVQKCNTQDNINQKRKIRTIHTIPTLVQMSSSLQQQQQQQQCTSSTYNHQHHQHHHPYDQNHTDFTNNTINNNNNVNNNKIMIQKMIDNYHRIRIKQDQSKQDDFIIPFSKAIQNI